MQPEGVEVGPGAAHKELSRAPQAKGGWLNRFSGVYSVAGERLSGAPRTGAAVADFWFTC